MGKKTTKAASVIEIALDFSFIFSVAESEAKIFSNDIKRGELAFELEVEIDGETHSVSVYKDNIFDGSLEFSSVNKGRWSVKAFGIFRWPDHPEFVSALRASKIQVIPRVSSVFDSDVNNYYPEENDGAPLPAGVISVKGE